MIWNAMMAIPARIAIVARKVLASVRRWSARMMITPVLKRHASRIAGSARAILSRVLATTVMHARLTTYAPMVLARVVDYFRAMMEMCVRMMSVSMGYVPSSSI